MVFSKVRTILVLSLLLGLIPTRGFSTTCTIKYEYYCEVWANLQQKRCAEPLASRPVYVDWDEQLCNIPILTPQSRCILEAVPASRLRTICSPQTAGCDTIPGGCIGNLEPGNWAVVQVLVNKQLVERRCVCGCFAEETAVESNHGPIAATRMLEEKDRIENGEMQFVTTSGFDAEPLKSNTLTQLVAGPETEASYTLYTRSGRTLTLSGKHPVYITNQEHQLQEVRKAEDLETGLALSTLDGDIDIIERIEKGDYAGRMVNFTVDSTRNSEHFFFGNQIKIGDNAWQQYLVKRQARMISRNQILIDLMHP